MSDAEDLAQEVLLRMSRRGRIAELNSIDFYAYHIASNLLVDFRRRAARQGPQAALNFDVADPGVAVDRAISSRQELNCLLLKLKKLPSKTQRIFYLYRIEELSQPEIARVLDVALRTVEDHLARASRYILDLSMRPS